MFPNLEGEQARKMQTNEDLARILGISRQSYESKKKTRNFKLTEIKNLCDFYRCNF